MNCPRCGAILAPDAHQCDRCGLLFGTLEGPRVGPPSRPRPAGPLPSQWTVPPGMDPNGPISRPRATNPDGSGQWPMPIPPDVMGPPSRPRPNGAGAPGGSGQWMMPVEPPASGQWMVPTTSQPGAMSRPRLSLPDLAAPGPRGRPANDLRNGLFAGAAIQQGRLRVLSPFGPGMRQLPGMSLWLASDASRRGDRVVVMELPFAHLSAPEASKMREMMALRLEALGKHPAFPQLLAAFTEQGRHFLVFAYSDGEFLSDRVQRLQGPLPERLVLSYGRQLLEGLQFLEQQSPPAVHGLICPETILISRDGREARFALWSPHVLARALNPAFNEAPPPMPGYRAPELQRGQLDARSDLYSLGATLFMAATGSDAEKRSAGIFPAARSLNPAISAPTDVVLGKAVRLIPSQRFQHADDMLLDVDRAERGESPTRDSLSQMEPIFSARVVRPVAISVAGIAAILLVATLIFTLVSRAPTSTLHAMATLPPTATVNPTIAALATKNEGISTGQTIFDVDARTAGATDSPTDLTPGGAIAAEMAGAAALRAGDLPTAAQDFQQATVDDPSNPEARIYLANTRIAATHSTNFITLELAVSFDPADEHISNQVLRGVALAQSRFNNDTPLPSNTQVMIEIASLGPAAEAAPIISKYYLQQIANGNPEHSLGVISWAPKNVDTPTLTALNIGITTLTTGQVPIVVPLTTVDKITPSPYLFRLSPSNQTQGFTLAGVALTHTYPGNAILVATDASNFTDYEMGQYAIGALQARGANVVPLSFHSAAADQGAAELLNVAKRAQYFGAQNIIFLGDATGLVNLMKQLLAGGYYTPQNLPNILAAATADDPALLDQVDATAPTYNAAQWVRQNQVAMLHVSVLGLADPGEWDFVSKTLNVPNIVMPDFFTTFGNTFTPPSATQALTPDAFAILAYDAMRLMLTPLAAASKQWTATTLPTLKDERAALAAVTDGAPFQGISGRIAFDPTSGLTVNRTMVLKTITFDTVTSATGDRLLRWTIQSLIYSAPGFCVQSQHCSPS